MKGQKMDHEKTSPFKNIRSKKGCIEITNSDDGQRKACMGKSGKK